MADAFTGTGQVTLDQVAYDRAIYKPLRAELYYDKIADVMPTRQSMPGSAVIFNKSVEMAAAITALSETVDVDAVALSNTQVTVTLVEQGSAVITSARLRAFSMVEINPWVADMVGRNAGVSMDTIVLNMLMTATNVRYVGQASRVALTAANILTAAEVRRARANLAGASVRMTDGQLYAAFIHPDVSYDLRSETGAAAWRDPHTYSQPKEIWTGEVGAFEGFRFIETPRAFSLADAGAGGTVDVYATLFMGKEALAKAYSTNEGGGPQPRVILGPVVDKMMRFKPVSWYWLGGYAIFRQEAIRRVESASSIAVNV